MLGFVSILCYLLVMQNSTWTLVNNNNNKKERRELTGQGRVAGEETLSRQTGCTKGQILLLTGTRRRGGRCWVHSETSLEPIWTLQHAIWNDVNSLLFTEDVVHRSNPVR